METAFFEVGKKAVFLQLLENPLNGINITLALVLGIDEDVIEVNNDKDIKFLGQDFVNLALKADRCVWQLKKYYLVLEVAVSSLESYFPFIALFSPHLMVSTHKIKLDE